MKRNAQLRIIRDNAKSLVAHDEINLRRCEVITAIEEERRRIAQELHDDIGQQLALQAWEVWAIEKRVPEAESELKAELFRIYQNLGAVSENLNAITRGLHPSMVARLGLNAALRSLCDRFASVYAVQVTFDSDCDDTKIPARVALPFFRITQEALRNIAKHARASTVLVSLECVLGRVRLRIRDSGVGFDAQRSRGNPGVGLFSMRERAKMIGGTLIIHSKVGFGTVVEVSAA